MELIVKIIILLVTLLAKAFGITLILSCNSELIIKLKVFFGIQGLSFLQYFCGAILLICLFSYFGVKFQSLR